MKKVTRKTLFDYMDLKTRNEYLEHRTDFDKNGTRWKLNERSKELLLRAKEISWDTETIPEPPPGTYQHLTKGVRKNLGLTYLTEITHIAFYAIVDGEEVIVVMVAPFTEEEESFARQLISKQDKLDIGHNQAFDIRIWCGHHDTPVPRNTYCTKVGNTTMMGGPNMGYPDGSKRGLDSLMTMYGVEDKIIPYVADAALDWAESRVDLYTDKLGMGLSYQDEYIGFIDQHADISQIREGLKQPDKLAGIVAAWQSFMKAHRNVLHTLPAKWVSAYVASDSIGTYWVKQMQMYYSKILQEQFGYTALWERHREDQRYQNILNRWAVRGMPINREWLEQQLIDIEAEKQRWIPYFAARGCGDMTKADHKFRFIFHICQCPEPDPWEWVDFGNDKGKWYPAEMQNSLWTDSAFDNIPNDGWEEEHDYSNWYSTGSDAIEYYLKFGPEEHRSKLRLYQYYTGMLSQEATYREWLDHASYDGKVHPLLTMTANSGRTIGGTPNPLNLGLGKPHKVMVFDPVTGGEVEVLEFSARGIFAPHEGKVLLEFDASNAEVRFAAVVAKAVGLAKAFAEKRDMHRENSAAFRRKLVEDITKDERNADKAKFFAMQYGGGARTIASRTHDPVAIVADMINGWNETNYEIPLAKQQIENDGWQRYQTMQSFPLPAARQAYTEIFNGRWIPAPMAWGRSRPKLYTLWNSQQQGGVAGIVVPAVIATEDFLEKHPELESEIYIMYHDAIVLEVPEDNEEAARTAGEFVAKQLMTQVPFNMTVVNGIPVPWPSGCDLYENQYKWGWRPDKEFPYYCGEGEGEVVITFPESEAWKIMLDKELASIKRKGRAKERELDQHYHSFPLKQIPWITEDDKIDPCVTKENALKYSIEEHEHQSRKWGNLQPLVEDAELLLGIRAYRAWVARASQLHDELEGLTKLYGDTKRTGEGIIGQT